MNFLSIEYFAAVASEHSFSKAAKRLGITQQTLSANIAALERELGCTLFVRHVPLELTYAGTVFARYAQRFRRDRDALGQEMRDIAGDQAGVLRVGVAYTRSRAIMPPIVKAMQRDCPNIIVELIEGRNDQIQQWLANGDLDLAVADFAGKPAGIELMDFYNERMVLVLAQSLWMDLAATGAASEESLIRQIQVWRTDKIPLGTKGRTSILSVESSASCGASFPVSRRKLPDRACFVTSFRQGGYTPLHRLCGYPLWTCRPQTA